MDTHLSNIKDEDLLRKLVSNEIDFMNLIFLQMLAWTFYVVQAMLANASNDILVSNSFHDDAYNCDRIELFWKNR